MKQFKLLLCRHFGHRFFTSQLLDVVFNPFDGPYRYCRRCGRQEPVPSRDQVGTRSVA
jgi:hypothetical protein